MNKIFSFFLVFSIVLRLSAGEVLEDPKDYQKNSDLQYQWAIESLNTFPLEANDKVLDLGCGTGSITIEIAGRVHSGIVIGLDISKKALNFAIEHHRASNIIYMEGDARNLPFKEQFDKVTAFLSLNWICEQDQALSSIYSALKLNGKAIIIRPGKQPSNLGPIAEALAKTDYWAPYLPNYENKKNYYSSEEYKFLLERAGFVVEKISEDSTYTYFKDRTALTGFFRPLCTFLTHLSPELQKQFVDEIIDEVLKTNPILKDGSILLHDFKLEVTVSKPS